MKYIDVRLRIPLTKLGQLIEQLPDWAPMIGYDKLEPVEVRHRGGNAANGEYKPGKGTASEAVLKALTKPMRRFEIIEKLKRVQKEKAVSSAIHALANKGLIKKNRDGHYGKA